LSPALSGSGRGYIRSQPTVTHWTRFIPRALNVHRKSGAGPMLSHLMSAAQARALTLVI
jgi:hypothetical protein